MTTFIFSKGELLATLASTEPLPLMRELPKDAFIKFDNTRNNTNRWYRPDLTPVLLEDVPKEYRAMLLLLI